MAAAEEFFFDVEEEDWAEDGGGEGKEENSTDPQNRALPDILKIVSVFLPSVGEDGRLLSTDIPDRLKSTFFAGNGTLKMNKSTHKRRYQATNKRQTVTQAQTTACTASCPTTCRTSGSKNKIGDFSCASSG